MRRPHPSIILPPRAGHHHSRLRAAASLVAALCGGFAVLGAVLLIVATITPAESPVAYVGVGVLTLIWLTGIWSRWDSPDHRMPKEERERRGY